MIHKYPAWKYALLLLIALIGVIYAIPNLYGNDPALQISGSDTARVGTVQADIVKRLAQAGIAYKALQVDTVANRILIRFSNGDVQAKAQDAVQAVVSEHYTVALNLAPAAPLWLRRLGAMPMKLGLDLQGGVHFLLEVDVPSVVEKHLTDNMRGMAQALRKAHVRYLSIVRRQDDGIAFQFRDAATLDQAQSLVAREYPYYKLEKSEKSGNYTLVARLLPAALQTLQQQTLDQTMVILRNRINELGVAEPIVQQQGIDRIAVDLPGIQDTARAQRILGDTATLEFRLVDMEHDPRIAAQGIVPMGSRLYRREQGQPILLQDEVLLSGKSITNASASIGSDARPAVNISVSGSDVKYFSHVTARNVGKSMAIVYVSIQLQHGLRNGKEVLLQHKQERIVSVATIQSGLGANFVINGLNGTQEANNLALTLRSGALLAPVNIVESRLVGPSLGLDNIHKGMLSLALGLLLVAAFMALYYRVFGLIADLALLLNLILLTAVLSIIGAVLTLPGMAGIVLTLGMAVDANVLIDERIREELRNGVSPQLAIQAGYDRALATIIDANITTMLVALSLFVIGSGAVRGFALTLTLGLLTSMLTGVTFTRAWVALLYGGRPLKRISIGI